MSIFTEIVKSELNSALVCSSMLKSDIEVLRNLIEEKTRLLAAMNVDILRIDGLDLDCSTRKTMCNQLVLKYQEAHEPKYSSSLTLELDWLDMSLKGKLDSLERCSEKITELKRVLSEDSISLESEEG